MFKVTPAAAEQIRLSAADSSAEQMPLRIAARKNSDGSIEYGMGFDQQAAGDQRIESEGVSIVIAAAHLSLLEAAIMDYVELQPNEFAFIFLNPNDANYSPPKDE